MTDVSNNPGIPPKKGKTENLENIKCKQKLRIIKPTFKTVISVAQAILIQLVWGIQKANEFLYSSPRHTTVELPVSKELLQTYRSAAFCQLWELQKA